MNQPGSLFVNVSGPERGPILNISHSLPFLSPAPGFSPMDSECRAGSVDPGTAAAAGRNIALAKHAG